MVDKMYFFQIWVTRTNLKVKEITRLLLRQMQTCLYLLAHRIWLILEWVALKWMLEMQSTTWVQWGGPQIILMNILSTTCRGSSRGTSHTSTWATPLTSTIPSVKMLAMSSMEETTITTMTEMKNMVALGMNRILHICTHDILAQIHIIQEGLHPKAPEAHLRCSHQMNVIMDPQDLAWGAHHLEWVLMDQWDLEDLDHQWDLEVTDHKEVQGDRWGLL